MQESDDRFMRLMVFFDLPVDSRETRRIATKFRKFLIRDGYHMLQWSVYARICKGADTVEKHKGRLRVQVPAEGNVRVMQVTESQYCRMELYAGQPKKIEKFGSEQLILF